jgi:hypothetical protein
MSMLKDERGAALMFALGIMVILAVIGASALMTSTVDIKVSGTTKVVREAFYLADGGIEMSPKVLGRIIKKRALPSFAETPPVLYDGLIYDDSASPSGYVTDTGQAVTLLDKVMAYETSDDSSNDTSDIAMDRGTQGSIAVDVTRVRTMYLSGGGTEFASGTEGVGVGGAAGTAVIYDFTSTGTTGSAPNTTESQIVARYRKVMGVAGGR